MLTLTPWENYSITANVTKAMAQLNQPEEAKYLILTAPTSRIVGAVVIPFAALGDAFAHLTSAAGKIVTGIIISPYNTLAVVFFPDSAAAIDYEFSSALVHLIRTIQSLFDGVTLPFICLLNPARAHQYMQHRLGEVPTTTLSRAQLERELNEINEAATRRTQIEELKSQIRQAEARLHRPSTQMPPLNVPNPTTTTTTTPLRPLAERRIPDMATPMKRDRIQPQTPQLQTSVIPPFQTPVQTLVRPPVHTPVHTPIPVPTEIPPQVQTPIQTPIPIVTTTPTDVKNQPSSLLDAIRNRPRNLKKTVVLNRKDIETIESGSLVRLVCETLPNVKQFLNQMESALQNRSAGDFFALTKAIEVDSDNSDDDDEWGDKPERPPLPMLQDGSYPTEVPLEPLHFELLKNVFGDKTLLSHEEFSHLCNYYKRFNERIEEEINWLVNELHGEDQEKIEMKKQRKEIKFVDNMILRNAGLQSKWTNMVQNKDFSEVHNGPKF